MRDLSFDGQWAQRSGFQMVDLIARGNLHCLGQFGMVLAGENLDLYPLGGHGGRQFMQVDVHPARIAFSRVQKRGGVHGDEGNPGDHFRLVTV